MDGQDLKQGKVDETSSATPQTHSVPRPATGTDGNSVEEINSPLEVGQVSEMSVIDMFRALQQQMSTSDRQLKKQVSRLERKHEETAYSTEVALDKKLKEIQGQLGQMQVQIGQEVQNVKAELQGSIQEEKKEILKAVEEYKLKGEAMSAQIQELVVYTNDNRDSIGKYADKIDNFRVEQEEFNSAMEGKLIEQREGLLEATEGFRQEVFKNCVEIGAMREELSATKADQRTVAAALDAIKRNIRDVCKKEMKELSKTTDYAHNDFNHKQLMKSLSTFDDSQHGVHPVEFLTQVELIESMSEVPWKLFRILLESHFRAEPLAWFRARANLISSFEQFSKEFMEYFWNFSRQQKLLSEITGNFVKYRPGISFATFAASLRHKNSFLTHPLDELGLIWCVIEKLPREVQIALSNPPPKNFEDLEKSLLMIQSRFTSGGKEDQGNYGQSRSQNEDYSGYEPNKHYDNTRKFLNRGNRYQNQPGWFQKSSSPFQNQQEITTDKPEKFQKGNNNFRNQGNKFQSREGNNSAGQRNFYPNQEDKSHPIKVCTVEVVHDQPATSSKADMQQSVQNSSSDGNRGKKGPNSINKQS